jgi:hypothetical protein
MDAILNGGGMKYSSGSKQGIFKEGPARTSVHRRKSGHTPLLQTVTAIGQSDKNIVIVAMEPHPATESSVAVIVDPDGKGKVRFACLVLHQELEEFFVQVK